MNAAVTGVLARGVRWFPSPHRPTRYEIVRSTRRNGRIRFEAFLEGADHLLNRPYDPPSRGGNVSLLFRILNQVEDHRRLEDLGTRVRLLFPDKMHLEVAPFRRAHLGSDVVDETLTVRVRLLAEEEIKLIDAVDGSVRWYRRAGDVRESRKEVRNMDHLVGHSSGRHMMRPTDHERSAQSATLRTFSPLRPCMTYGSGTTVESKPGELGNIVSSVVRGIPYHSSKPRSFGYRPSRSPRCHLPKMPVA